MVAEIVFFFLRLTANASSGSVNCWAFRARRLMRMNTLNRLKEEILAYQDKIRLKLGEEHHPTKRGAL